MAIRKRVRASSSRNVKMVQVHWTCGSLEEARTLCRLLLEKRLIACASFFPIRSLFSWKGELVESEEVKVILKTQDALFDSIVSEIQSLTTYEVPEIVKVPIKGSSRSYLEWLQSVTC